MKNIKTMLLGLAVMILPTALNLFASIGFLAYIVALIGLFFVVAGFLQNAGSGQRINRSLSKKTEN